MKAFRLLHIVLAILAIQLVATSLPAWGETDDDSQSLDLFTGEEEQIVTTSRSPRPVSRIAENVTVITAEQIARLNAHTLLDILQVTPSIQLDHMSTPASWSGFNINGFSFEHVLVLLDGVPQNDLVTNFPDAGLIPASQIERVEIIKGAASATWGPALGGVVNVITKSPEPGKPFGGGASASYGERRTSDLNGELSGTVNRFGYYLSGGNLHSEGHLPGNGINFNHAWGKLAYDLPSKGFLSLSGTFRDASRGLEESTDFNYRDTEDLRYYHLIANYSQPLSEQLSLELNARFHRLDDRVVWGSIISDPNYPPLLFNTRQISQGTHAKLHWDNGSESLVAGLEYSHDAVRWDLGDRRLDRVGTYLNGSFSFGAVTILPGIRVDHTGLGQNTFSYTLGSTWRLSDKTVLRAYGASGYGLPQLNSTDSLQRIWTVQAGAETGAVPFLWLKGTLFYNDIWNILPDDPSASFKEQIKQGFELEARTLPVFNLALSTGYTYTDARDRETGDRLTRSAPMHSLKLALNYDHSRLGLKGTLTGNYVWWHEDINYLGQGYYKPIVWDLHLSQKLVPTAEQSPELFFSMRNLFNGSQYNDNLYHNTPRWIEGGVRFRF